ncbi:transglycosylase family protein [Streptomyces kronopolitis]|uniref:LysM peptidoglycan-binding domain-containing protein n=1 Tax=Streptomyces kronopolitis TaxID=1612435 RepID=UPI003412D360
MQHSQTAESVGSNKFRLHRVRGVAVAAALLAAGALNLASGELAEARTGGAWDRLAGCESGGNWRTDTGNGFSGGLQFTHSTWHAYGGSAYASRASRATRAQQIQVAKRVLARQGWRAWPACSSSLGLNSAPRHLAPRRTNRRVAPRWPSSTATRGWVRHPQAHYQSDRHRSGSGSLTVNVGDTVSGLANSHGCGWHEFYWLNRKVIGVNPDIIFPGMRLLVPSSRD